jgi:chromate reductase, NAD(P)H dehydrogenase (quinone)
MPTLLGLSGSLRKASLNTALLRAAAAAMPEGFSLDVRTVHGVPLYDADLQAEGLPRAVVALKDALASSAGLIIATPEYNQSVPGVLKNTIDWMSRPPADIPRVFAGKPVALMGATTGAFATIAAQNAWLPILRTLRMTLWTGGRLAIPNARTVFDEAGAIADAAVGRQLGEFVAGFCAFAARA